MSIESELTALRRPAPASIAAAVELGTGMVDGYQVHDSPIGPVVVVFNPHGVAAVEPLDEAVEERHARRFGRRLVEARPPAAWRDGITRAIERGTPGRLPVDLRLLTEFQRQVLHVAAAIPRGQVRPYGWLAARVGRPRAARAVGSTMAGNPVPLIIPCHRVVRADGHIGAYSLGGPDNKWTLLTAEGADPAGLEVLAARGVRFVGSATTRVFCLPTCSHARRISHRHRVEFHSEAEAGEAGFRPCAVCRPVVGS